MIDLKTSELRRELVKDWGSDPAREPYNDAWGRVQQARTVNRECTGCVLCALAVVKLPPC